MKKIMYLQLDYFMSETQIAVYDLGIENEKTMYLPPDCFSSKTQIVLNNLVIDGSLTTSKEINFWRIQNELVKVLVG